MMSVGSAGSVGYYTGSVGGGRENYYLDAVTDGEPPGRWSGALAERLGLVGEVDADVMHALYEGFVGPDGTLLGQAPGQYRSVEERLADRLAAEPDAIPERVEQIRREVESSSRTACHAVDLTFSVPKSVTVAHTAVWRAELEAVRSGQSDRADRFRGVRLGIENAIHEANAAGLEYASGLTLAMVGKGTGRTWRAAPGLVVASFFQHTARAARGSDRGPDPQLHTHNVVLNRAECVDGSIRALDGHDLRQQRGAVSAVMDRVLGERLSALGLAMETRPDGKAREIVDIPQEVRDLFSTRRRAITEALAPKVKAAEERVGRELSNLEVDHLARQVTLETRQGKTHEGESEANMLDRWQATMRAELSAGLVPLGEKVLSAYERGPAAGAERWSPSSVISAALEAVSKSEATWRRSDLMREIELRLPGLGGLSAADTVKALDSLTDKALESAGVVQITGIEMIEAPESLRVSSDLRRPPGAVRYASSDSLIAEHAIREAGVTRGRYALDAEAVGGFLDEKYPTMGADQRAAVVGIASSDAALAQMVGPAGAGKSFAMGGLSAVWGSLSEGGRVVGLAVSQNAAQVLAEDGVQVTANVAAFLGAQQRIAEGRAIDGDEAYRIGARDILLVDEASMVDRDTVTRLRELVDEAGGRMLFTGDPRQLAAVGAGGVMDLTEGYAETYTLTDVRRFRDADGSVREWEAAASLRLRDGDLSALEEYDRRGRIVGAKTTEDAVQSAARSAAADHLEGLSTIVVTGSNEDAALVAAAVREHLVRAGVVAEGGMTLPLDGTLAAAGDLIMARENDYGAGVVNRETFRVLEVGDDGSLRVEPAEREGTWFHLPAEYVRRAVQSAYAATAHAAQGRTTDTCHLVTDGTIDAAGLYVGLSRGRRSNTAHVSCNRLLGVEAGEGIEGPIPTDTPLSVLESVISRESSDTAALVMSEQDRARQQSLDQVVSRIEDAQRAVTRDRLERHLDELVVDGVLSMQHRSRLCADQATDYLSRVMHSVERTGADPREVLREAIGSRDLGGSDSVAKVIATRVTKTHDLREVAAGPAEITDIPQEWAEYIGALEQVAQERTEALGVQAVKDAPAWAVETLGPVPEDAVARLEWQGKAGAVAAAREVTGWADERVPLDAAPGVTAPAKRDVWESAWSALGQPEAWRDEAAMTDGQLRVRVQAWEREKTWAPPYPDDALRYAEQSAEQARTESVLEGADRAPVAEHRERAKSLETAVQGRQAWAVGTAVTRATGERARDELQRRGVEVGAEADSVTGDEWVTEAAEQRKSEDRWRQVTEADVQWAARDADQAEDVAQVEETDSTELPQGDRHEGRGAAHVRLPEEPTTMEIEAATAASVAALERVADRESQDRTAAAEWTARDAYYDARAAGGSQDVADDEAVSSFSS